MNEPWTACEDPGCGECLQRQLQMVGLDLDRAEAQLKIATDALEFIRLQQDKGEAHPSPGVIADDALIQMSVVE